MVPFMLGIVSY